MKTAPKTGIVAPEGCGVLWTPDEIEQGIGVLARSLEHEIGDQPFKIINLGEQGSKFKSSLLRAFTGRAACTGGAVAISNLGPDGAPDTHLLRFDPGDLKFIEEGEIVVLAQGRRRTGGTAEFAKNYASRLGAKVITAALINHPVPGRAAKDPDFAVFDIPDPDKITFGYGMPPYPGQYTDPKNRKQYVNPEIAKYFNSDHVLEVLPDKP